LSAAPPVPFPPPPVPALPPHPAKSSAALVSATRINAITFDMFFITVHLFLEFDKKRIKQRRSSAVALSFDNTYSTLDVGCQSFFLDFFLITIA
jgi:hypothetical protein